MGLTRTAFAATAVLAALASSTGAATMTWDDFDHYDSSTSYYEDRITVVGDDLAPYGLPGHVHGGDKLTFSMGSRFDAVSFDLYSWGFNYLICEGDSGSCVAPTFKNVRVTGYRGNDRVANLLFKMQEDFRGATIRLGERFSNLSSLVIEALLPKFPTSPNVYVDCSESCSHFDIGNITLAPIPLPAGLPLAASGLALLGLVGLRRRAA